jgi:short-subunit dehydrogenase
VDDTTYSAAPQVRRTILITGASSGIGRALARRAAAAGFAVVAVGRNREALDALAAVIHGGRGEVETLAIDIADPTNARTIVERALARFGRIDVLVNNAGVVATGPLAAQSDHDLAVQFGTHAIGPIAIVREALPALEATKGHVFMLGSGVARVPVGGLGAYPAAKAATRSATSTLRLELRPRGIRVTYVDPGAVDTPFMTRAGMPGAPPAMLAAPDRVARAIVRAIGTDAREVNAVPWQTFGVALAALFPRVTDAILARAPGLVGTTPQPAPALQRSAPVAADHGVVPLPANDAVITAETIVQTEPIATIAPPVRIETSDAAEPSPAEPLQTEQPDTGLADALAGVSHRMERLKLTNAVVASWLVPGTTVSATEAAMRWAGMPNKNERALVDEIFAALAEAGYVTRASDDADWRVVRG